MTGADPAYLAGLPRTRGGSSALLVDPDGRILVVKPTYREGWLLPGGVIEEGESPLTACRREAKEELGLTIVVDGLAGFDWIPPREGRDACNVFVFAGPLSRQQAADVRLPPDELSDFRLVAPAELPAFLLPHMARRVRACLAAHCAGRTAYLHHGAEVGR